MLGAHSFAAEQQRPLRRHVLHVEMMMGNTGGKHRTAMRLDLMAASLVRGWNVRDKCHEISVFQGGMRRHANAVYAISTNFVVKIDA